MNFAKYQNKKVKINNEIFDFNGFYFSLKDNSVKIMVQFKNGDVESYPIKECKFVKIVKRKKSQVLVDSLERIMALSSMGSEIYNEAEAALEKYRAKKPTRTE
jgi:hypothetical protein